MSRFAFVFVAALLVAAGASLLLFRVVGSSVPHAAAVPTTSKVLFAARDLAVGALIEPHDLTEGQWFGEAPPQLARKKEDLLGRGVVASIYQGEPIWLDRVAVKGAGAGLAATIPNGKRAVALRVNEVIGLAGFVLPGMHVDVIASGAPQGGAGGGSDVVSRTILQNIEVLSAGQKIERSTDGKPVEVQVVNLLVTPDQAEVLSLASNETKVQLVLRNPLDEGEKHTQGAVLHTILAPSGQGAFAFRGSPVPRPEVRNATVRLANVFVVEVYHGSKKVDESFSLRPAVHR